MDSAYFQLIEGCNRATRLATYIAKNANYKEVIRTASDPIIVDGCKEVARLCSVLQEILNRQEYANVKSMPG